MEATQVERALDEGRRLVDAGELRGALVPLERARQEFLRAGDLAGLRQVRRAVEGGVHSKRSERDAIRASGRVGGPVVEVAAGARLGDTGSVGERRRQRAERALAEARAQIEAGDATAALRPLERARKDYLGEADLSGLREVRRAAERGYTSSADAGEAAYERLLYASAQNVRFLSRRRAAAAGEPWRDPHPELDLPDRPEIRAERGIGRRDVPWILVSAVVGAAVVAGVVAFYVWAFFFAADGSQRATIVNDTSRPVVVGVCAGYCDSVRGVRLLRDGQREGGKTSFGDDLWFVVSRPSGRRIGCVRGRGGTVHVSDAGGCPPVPFVTP